jgi:hypothetical protein
MFLCFGHVGTVKYSSTFGCVFQTFYVSVYTMYFLLSFIPHQTQLDAV